MRFRRSALAVLVFAVILAGFTGFYLREQYGAELVLIAATTGEEADLESATAQMERALRRDTWL
jgi:hypothetical protein